MWAVIFPRIVALNPGPGLGNRFFIITTYKVINLNKKHLKELPAAVFACAIVAMEMPYIRLLLV